MSLIAARLRLPAPLIANPVKVNAAAVVVVVANVVIVVARHLITHDPRSASQEHLNECFRSSPQRRGKSTSRVQHLVVVEQHVFDAEDFDANAQGLRRFRVARFRRRRTFGHFWSGPVDFTAARGHWARVCALCFLQSSSNQVHSRMTAGMQKRSTSTFDEIMGEPNRLLLGHSSNFFHPVGEMSGPVEIHPNGFGERCSTLEVCSLLALSAFLRGSFLEYERTVGLLADDCWSPPSPAR